MSQGWFEVDKAGLAQLVRRKGMAFLLNELVQNAWDTRATQARVCITPIPNKAAVNFSVYDDDPDGFKDITHAYTLFAPSEKKGQADKRGRYNLGEKLVLAACSSATISTTTGTILFEQKGKKLTRRQTSSKRGFGSLFEAVIPMTRAEMGEVIDAADLLLPPIDTTINDKGIPTRTPIHTFTVQLPTETADEEGFLRRTARQTQVRIYEPFNGTSYLYEMGIPVVETELPWSVEIMQKVPLNSDRDNVTPAYLRQVGVHVVNEMHDKIKPADAALPIIQEALGDDRIEPEAVKTILTHQFGKNRTIFDPSDMEANHNAVAHGHNVIPGRAFNSGQWSQIKRAGAAQASGKLFPTPKLYDPNGDPARYIPEDKLTDGHRAVRELAVALGQMLMDAQITVTFEAEMTQGYLANYGHRHLTFNAYRLGKKWFDLRNNAQAILDLIIHEFGHHYASSHLDAAYHDALTRLGAKLTMLAIREPEFFAKFGIE